MRAAVAVAVTSLGLSAAAYGLASLTGCWLGQPPWWETREERASSVRNGFTGGPLLVEVAAPREGRERISGSLVATGFAAAVVGLAFAWPRRGNGRTSDESKNEFQNRREER